MSPSPRTIVVVGALGNQGSGVVQGLLADASSAWHVRGLTRDPEASNAKEFLSRNQTADGRLSLVAGFPYDPASLKRAFAGAYGVFALTNQMIPGRWIEDEEELKHEIEAGTNLISAAKEAGVKHFVFTSCPDVSKASGGRFTKVYHMDFKAQIEQLARKELPGFTAITPAFFYTNLRWPLYTRLREDGVVRFCYPIPSNQPCQWADPTHDMGAFTARIFKLGVEKTNGKSYYVQTPAITPAEMASIFTRVTGKPAVHEPTTTYEFGATAAAVSGPAYLEDAKEMMDWASMCPPGNVNYGTLDPEHDETLQDLGLEATSFEAWLKRSGWTGPDEVFSAEGLGVEISATKA